MITLVAAIGKDNCIGSHGGLPWNIPEDMKRMREFTRGKVLIMGRKTYESIPENRRPLPDRTNVIITSDANYAVPIGVEKYKTINEAIAAHKDEEIIGFGGEKIFTEMLPLADALEITHVNQTVEECSAYFPPIDLAIWHEVSREDWPDFSFVRYERI